MKQRYQSPAWISAAMDDAGLTPHEFRVLAHVCRRAGDGSNGRGCDASISGISRACAMKRDTVRGCLQRLAELGWIAAEVRPGRATAYWPRFPDGVAPSVSDGKPMDFEPPEGDPSPETANPWPNGGRGGGQMRGDEGNPEGKPMKGTRFDTVDPTDDCERSPQSSDGVCDPQPLREEISPAPEIFEEDARAWARQFHMLEGRSAGSALAMFPPEEVETWAVDWLVTMQARGWQLGGAPVVNPRAALRGYLRKAAAGRSKRFREISRDPGTAEAADTDDIPF